MKTSEKLRNAIAKTAEALRDSHRPQEVKDKISKARRKELGHSYNMDGFKYVKVTEDRYRGEHRIIAEQALGRRLTRGEVVHHIDCNERNNDKGNLLICDRAYPLDAPLEE